MKSQNKALKRSRGEIACAECRRQKVKCDRKVPCATCVKRGCPSLCPNGTIPPGEGSRFVLAATEHLQSELSRMEARMRALEDALAISQAMSSSEPHPLLAHPEQTKCEEDQQSESIVSALDDSTLESDELGALFVEATGFSKFFKLSGGTEVGEHIEDTPETLRLHRPELDEAYIPTAINEFYRSFPFTPVDRPVEPVQSAIEALLPPIDRSIKLCNIFLEHLSWMTQIVTRKQMNEDLIPAVYQRTDNTYGPHDLAVVLVVMSIGALLDLTMEPYNVEAQYYYRLARAAATLQPVLVQQSVQTVKLLHLMSIYNGLTGIDSNLEQSFALLNLAGQAALRIGFHVDPSFWGLTGKEAYDRRNYFWNLVQGSFWQGIVTGRPPLLLPKFVECQIPTPEEDIQYQEGEVPAGFGIWGFHATRECLIHLTQATLSAKPPPYEAILELDQKIRDYADPAKMSRHIEIRGQTAISMRSFVKSHYQDLMLLFLHRAHFAQAMMENPADPLAGPHGRSVTAAYQSACVILDDTRAQFEKQPMLCARIWRIWTHAFSAAVVVGTLAIQGRQMQLRPDPLQQFSDACDVFREAAKTSWRAARAMPVLDTMLARARDADLLTLGLGQADMFTVPTTFVQPMVSSQVQQTPMEVHSSGRRLDPVSELNIPSTSLDMTPQEQATYTDFSRGWESLFHEAPISPAYGGGESRVQSSYVHGEGAMLEDRWSSFMHNYGSLNTQPVTSIHYNK